METSFDPITLEIIWKRLISIVDQSAQTLYRSSFSTVVRESHDYTCMLLDSDCSSIVQPTRSIPSFIGTLPASLKHFMEHYKPDTLRPGDVIICNDPWICSGHLPDITMISPLFWKNNLIAFGGCIAHMADIGGRVRSPDSLSIYEEGLQIPICKLYSEGRLNFEIMEFIEKNVRVPEQVRGDLEAMVLSNQTLGSELEEFLKEYEMDDISALAKKIQFISERVMREAINKIEDGQYHYESYVDSFDSSKPLNLKVVITISGDEIKIDFSGSSSQTNSALNTSLNYTSAWSYYAIKASLCPDIPNNEGSFLPIKITADEGSVLNAKYPAAVAARATIGHYVTPMIFGALGKVIPEKVPAESGSPLFGMAIHGTDDDGKQYSGLFFINGGQGASCYKDGISCLSFPTNVSNTPVEVIESIFPVQVLCKELISDSGGIGKFRGGLGQKFNMRVLSKTPCSISLFSQRKNFPPLGLKGGKEAALGRIKLNNHSIEAGKPITLHKGDILSIVTPGGGGYGSFQERSDLMKERDLQNEFVSKDKTKDGFEC